jgi:tetratricopeptide (TPR) repeat protein
MQCRKIILSVLIPFITTTFAFAQSEALKVVVNDLAFYKQKNDLKYLSAAKKSADSLIITRSDTADVEKNTYRALVNASILYVDSLNKLGQPATLLAETSTLVDKLSANKKIYKFQAEIDYAKRCLANVYIRKGFEFTNNSDFTNARQSFENARKYAPNFKPITDYIAYSNNKAGNLVDAAKYYSNLLAVDSTRTEYIETASSIYKSLGDTSKALQILQKGRKLLPTDRFLLLDEANIYNNQKNYKALEPLIGPLLDINANNADIAFVAANCYDHLNKYDKAESLYLRTIELNSSAYDPVFNLGLLYLKQSAAGQEGNDDRNIGRAIQWLEKAYEISPNNVQGLKALQLAYAKTGNKDQLDKVNNKLKQITN